ncbi:S24/S26 family peptidase [Anaeromyxobacter oryzae]|uniref:hypothetical protein n=1 Tax=Anaeromyxobacter oryzae TaxID=2918170 RepID=UPI0020C05CCF|nr:hypothetical protein [Anaeromyxobacter oryzae]
MAPTLREGDEVQLAFVDGAPAPGDVVVARGRAGLVIHRVVGAGAGGIITRGDACPRNDPTWAPRQVIFTAVARRRRGREQPIPPAPPEPLRRLRLLARSFASRAAAPGRWWRARRSSSTCTGGGSWA